MVPYTGYFLCANFCDKSSKAFRNNFRGFKCCNITGQPKDGMCDVDYVIYHVVSMYAHIYERSAK